MVNIGIKIYFLLFLTFNIYSQSNNGVEITWYNLFYDEYGNINDFDEARNVNYDTPIGINIIFNGFRDNDFVKIIIVDDQGNVCFEEIREIRNNEISIISKLLTTEEYLENTTKPYIKFKCKINIMNEYFFESEYIEVNFAYRMAVLLRNDIPNRNRQDRYVLRSTDGYYQHEVHLGEDGILIGHYTYFTFPNLIPNKYYSLFQIGRTGEEFSRMPSNIPFHKLLHTIR